MTTKARAYVLFGQGDEATSLGMLDLSKRLSTLPGLAVSTHHWNQWLDVVKDIGELPQPHKVAIIGYSLGANATTWISNRLLNSIIDLIVAYDPSVYSVVLPADRNVMRGLLYHNSGKDVHGHAVIKGPQMEVTEINEGHLMVDFDRGLHSMTIDAVKRLLT